MAQGGFPSHTGFRPLISCSWGPFRLQHRNNLWASQALCPISLCHMRALSPTGHGILLADLTGCKRDCSSEAVNFKTEKFAATESISENSRPGVSIIRPPAGPTGPQKSGQGRPPTRQARSVRADDQKSGYLIGTARAQLCWRINAVMHTRRRVEHEASRGSSGSAATSRGDASGVEGRRKPWHHGK
jgi:hypothetical protein